MPAPAGILRWLPGTNLRDRLVADKNTMTGFKNRDAALNAVLEAIISLATVAAVSKPRISPKVTAATPACAA